MPTIIVDLCPGSHEYHDPKKEREWLAEEASKRVPSRIQHRTNDSREHHACNYGQAKNGASNSLHGVRLPRFQ
jgi:hypothetical protein